MEKHVKIKKKNTEFDIMVRKKRGNSLVLKKSAKFGKFFAKIVSTCWF